MWPSSCCRVTGLVWGLLLAFTCSLSAQDEDLADVIERCEQAVVRIEMETADGGGIGSGFIVDPSGILVTNVHVLAGARRAMATFPNGTRVAILGTLAIDRRRDICVAKLDGGDFPMLTFAPEHPRKGERVTALGSPQGLSFTATTGIVSAVRPAEELGPDIGRPEIQGTWIQVDAALSAGNSGGPLINARGEVVGMSTLASQGAAQNLNFGISGIDIRLAVEQARTTTMIVLADGIAKLREVVARKPVDMQLIQRSPIPRDRLEEYVAQGRNQFPDLQRGLKQEILRGNELLRAMRLGENFLPPGAPRNVDVVRSISIFRNKKKYKFYFNGQAVKDREIDQAAQRLKELSQIHGSAKTPEDAASLYAMLSQFGPRLDPRRKGSIGFVYDAVVMHSFNDHDVLIDYQDTPYLLWVESTTGLSVGSGLIPAPVYVFGTETIEPPGNPPTSVTVLYTVTEDELRTAILGHPAAGKGEWRVWKDASGKHQVEAQLLQIGNGQVRLRKRNGNELQISAAKLSQQDREYLDLP